MPQTPNKGLEVQVTGSNSGTWGSTLNSSVMTILDNNLGSVTSKSLTNVDVTLSATESQSAILRLTGTLTGNVIITTACIGFTYYENLTTGNFSVSLTNGVGSVVLPQSSRGVVLTDGTNGARVAADVFPSGTGMLFAQAAAPIGWTKSVSQDDASIRIVSGTGGGTGGSTGFSSVFTARTLSTAQLPSHSHGVTDPGHTHTVSSPSGSLNLNFSASFCSAPPINTVTGTSVTGISIQNTGSGSPIDFAVRYRDVLLCTKD